MPAASLSSAYVRRTFGLVDKKTCTTGAVQLKTSSVCTNFQRQKLKCKNCDFETLYRFALTRHQRIHTGDFFRCSLCTCHFSDSYQLQHHLKGHAGNLRCKICGRNFTNFSTLKCHEKRHMHKLSLGVPL